MLLFYCLIDEHVDEKATPRELNAKTATRLLGRVRIAADRMGFRREREDIAQEVLLRIIEGKHQHATIDQIVIDVLRQRSGRKGLPSYDTRRNLAQSRSIEHHTSDISVRVDPRATLDDRLDFERMVGVLRATDKRVIALLRWEYGFNEKEIAYLYGVTEARISQRLTAIQERISHALFKNVVPPEKRDTGDSELPKEATESTSQGPTFGLDDFIVGGSF